jgi:hypothetical protein
VRDITIDISREKKGKKKKKGRRFRMRETEGGFFVIRGVCVCVCVCVYVCVYVVSWLILNGLSGEL